MRAMVARMIRGLTTWRSGRNQRRMAGIAGLYFVGVLFPSIDLDERIGHEASTS